MTFLKAFDDDPINVSLEVSSLKTKHLFSKEGTIVTNEDHGQLSEEIWYLLSSINRQYKTMNRILKGDIINLTYFVDMYGIRQANKIEVGDIICAIH